MAKLSGLALMAGILLSVVASVLLPGNTIISPVDQTDFPEAVKALGDSAVLAQWMTFFSFLALVFMAFGLTWLYPLAGRQGGLGGRLLQFGIILTMIEWTVLFLATGMRHFVIHLMQRAELAADGSEFVAAALAIHTDMVSVTMTFLLLFPLASILVGLGLAQRFASMSIYKIGSYLMALGGAVGLVDFLIAINDAELGLDILLSVNFVALYVAAIGMFIIGLGMFQERSELVEETA